MITLKPQKEVVEPKKVDSEDNKEEPKIDEEAKTDSNTDVIQKPDKKRAKPTQEFKVLGVNDFEKKAKVIIDIL